MSLASLTGSNTNKLFITLRMLWHLATMKCELQLQNKFCEELPRHYAHVSLDKFTQGYRHTKHVSYVYSYELGIQCCPNIY